MRARRRVIGTIIATAAVLTAGCTSGGGVAVMDRTSVPAASAPDTTEPTASSPTTDPAEPADPVVAAIEWGQCDDETADDPALECAALTVPLDYADPEGETLDLALVRVPAEGDREGAVLFNPGGPGGSGFDPIANSGTVIQSELGLERLDIIGFDPRGVDRSGGIKCVDDAFQDAHLYLDDTPDTPEEQALLDEAEQGFNDGCKERYEDTLRFYSTENTARDMDAIRIGLGDEQISFLGISYGTYLGATYATLFPDRVRAMVLDSAFEPNGDTVEQQYLTQLVGFEGAFNDWVAWCEDDSACAYNAADVGARWDALLIQLDEQPLPADDGRMGNQAVLDTATSAALYSESEWPVLADALAKAEDGDPSGIFALADDYNGRNADGTFTSLFQSFSIIRCASGITSQPPDDPVALLQKIKEQAPRFGASTTLEDLTFDDGDVDGCKELTGEVEPTPLSYDGDGPIVVVGGTNDPATPFRWAEEMTSAMGSNARLVTFTGEGHGQLLASTCITEIEAALLAKLALPGADTVCDPDPAVDQPDWWTDLRFPDSFSDVTPLPAVNAALGLSDTLGFGEARTSELGAQDALDAFDETLLAAGFELLGNQDLGIDDTLENGYLSPSGELLIVIVMGPAAFETDELGGAKGSVPTGQTVVLYAFLPE